MPPTLVWLVTLCGGLPGRLECFRVEEKIPRCCKHWRLCGQHTQINRRLCRSPEVGWLLEMTRMATMLDNPEGSTRESGLPGYQGHTRE